MSRLSEVKKKVKLTVKHKHIMVEMKLTSGRTIKQLSNIHSDLTKFELDCVYIHMYKILDACHTSGDIVKGVIIGTNYAKVFGSPWSLE